MSEHSWRRTIAKGLTYRLTSFLIGTLGLSYFFNQPILITVGYSIVLTASGFALWVLNEILWRKTSWGKAK